MAIGSVGGYLVIQCGKFTFSKPELNIKEKKTTYKTSFSDFLCDCYGRRARRHEANLQAAREAQQLAHWAAGNNPFGGQYREARAEATPAEEARPKKRVAFASPDNREEEEETPIIRNLPQRKATPFPKLAVAKKATPPTPDSGISVKSFFIFKHSFVNIKYFFSKADRSPFRSHPEDVRVSFLILNQIHHNFNLFLFAL